MNSTHNKDCIFCKIINKELPAYTVYEDDLFLAFLDIAPATMGHTLLIPKYHCSDIQTLPEPYASNFVQTLQKIMKAVLNSQKTPHCNIIHNIGAEAGQVIFHTHFHIIPRFSGDGFIYPTVKLKTSEETLRECATTIKAQLLTER